MNILIAIPCFGGNISNLTFHSLFNCIKPLNDNTLSTPMLTYRQNLRDITNGLSTVDQINAVTWPIKP